MTVVTAEHRRRLESLQARVKAARESVQGAQRAVEMANKADDDDARHVARGALEQARGELDLAQGLERALLGQVAGVHFGGSESVLDNPSTVAMLEQVASSSAPIGSLMLGPVLSQGDVISMVRSGQWGSGAIYGAASTGGVVDTGPPTDPSRFGSPYGIVPQIRRRLRILDLIPTAPMDGGSFNYVQEGGAFTGPVETAESTLKPPGAVTLTDGQVVAVTVPAWLKVPRQQLADVGQLQGVLQGRLTYSVLRRVENQILAGDGTGANLKGILATSGIASITYSATSPLTDLTLDGITAVLVSDAEPDAVVMHPTDISAMLKAKASGSGERLDSEGAFAPTNSTIWDLPRIASTAITQGTALVGDFALGAQLFIREGVNVRVSDSDQDDFLRNRVTLLAETRVGLAVWQPACFALVHLA